jgi:hypothetical protein
MTLGFGLLPDQSVEILSDSVLRQFSVPALSFLSHVFIRNMLPCRFAPEPKTGRNPESDGISTGC